MGASVTFLYIAALAVQATPAAATRPPPPSVAIMSLETKAGITPDATELVTERLCASVTNARVFDRIVTSKELDATMGLEARKQLLNCNTDSCAAEIAGAWAVSHLITGSVGKLGNSIILNVKIIDVKVGAAVARLSEKVDGGEEALFDAMDPAVNRLLREAGFRPMAGAATQPGPSANTPSQPAAGAAPAQPASPVPVLRYALWGGGAAAALGAVLGVPLALLGGTTVALCLAGFFSGDPIAGAVRDATTYDVRRAGVVGGAAGLAVAVMVMMLLGATAAGLVTAGVFAG